MAPQQTPNSPAQPLVQHFPAGHGVVPWQHVSPSSRQSLPHFRSSGQVGPGSQPMGEPCGMQNWSRQHSPLHGSVPAQQNSPSPRHADPHRRSGGHPGEPVVVVVGVGVVVVGEIVVVVVGDAVVDVGDVVVVDGEAVVVVVGAAVVVVVGAAVVVVVVVGAAVVVGGTTVPGPHCPAGRQRLLPFP